MESSQRWRNHGRFRSVVRRASCAGRSHRGVSDIMYVRGSSQIKSRTSSSSCSPLRALLLTCLYCKPLVEADRKLRFHLRPKRRRREAPVQFISSLCHRAVRVLMLRTASRTDLFKRSGALAYIRGASQRSREGEQDNDQRALSTPDYPISSVKRILQVPLVSIANKF
ncbi:MAG: hypothetical protein ACI915_002022 [Gammaproteobacteria bacterium]